MRSVSTTPATPLSTMLAGCILVGASSTFIRLSGQQATTAAFYRCAIALLPLFVLFTHELRRLGRMQGAAVGWALASGVFLAGDYLMWTQSILDVGAAVATVLIGSQVIVFPLLARVIEGTQLSSKFAVVLPFMLAGLLFTGGIGTHIVDAAHPVRGTILGIAAGGLYAGYLYCNRRAGALNPRRVFGPVTLGTASATAVIGGFGLATQSITAHMPAASWAWLIVVAVGGQFLSFVLIGIGTARLSADLGAAVLLLQPLSGVVLGWAVLHERLAPLQLLGIALTVGCVAAMSVRGSATRNRTTRTRIEDAAGMRLADDSKPVANRPGDSPHAE